MAMVILLSLLGLEGQAPIFSRSYAMITCCFFTKGIQTEPAPQTQNKMKQKTIPEHWKNKTEEI
jgi:hypothetical protein